MATVGYGQDGPTRAATPPVTRSVLDAGMRAMPRISLQAIIAGGVIVISLQIVLGMLGAAIGLGMVEPLEGGAPSAGSFGIGAGLWWLVGSLASLAAGAYAAARLSGARQGLDGALHGLVTWGTALLLTIWLLGSAIGGMIGTAASGLGQVASAAGEGVAAMAPKALPDTGMPLSAEALRDRARAYLEPSDRDPATLSAEDAQKEVIAAMPKLLAGGPDATAQRDRIVAIMAAQLRIPQDEAARRFDDLQQRARQARAEAEREARILAEQTASAASIGSFLAVAALVLGALTAAFAGSAAARRRAEDELLLPA